MWGWLLCVAAVAVVGAECAGAGAARLVCVVEGGRTDGFSECSHLVYAGDARGDKLEALLKEYRKSSPRIKIVLRVGDFDKDLRSLLKSKHIQGLEIHDAHKTLNRTKVSERVEAARTAISASGGGPLFLALPANPELLAKYYDLRVLVKKVDLMMVQTHDLGAVKKTTYHPSRLSGMWDMMNTDSVVDLVVGLGIPASKVVISLPATARQFTLANETLSTPGSPALEDEPKEVDQAELCRLLQKGRWTLERDQDLSAPYAFKDKTWMSFEDSSSVDVKGKYARIRGLAGLALYRAERDVDTPCGPTLKTALAKVLNQQSRAPRAAVLRSLENEILSAPGHARALDALQVSPYRITQVVDSDGVIHSIREDTRTEFSCSRQGYFVHPRSCARFYRCVKFDQLSPEFTVFEFDCPAGLAFDSRYEVCVWPGSLPHSQACPGSSEIAPVPPTRFVCPSHEGYYADPENCRWFFACLDHGKAPLTAYEFRCPFGLGFDAEKLKCDWPWLVPACGNIARYEAEAHGFSAATLTGAVGFQGQTADAINVAAHQSLVSGASLNNLVGIQNGFLTKDDALDNNFIASQEFANQGGNGYQNNGDGIGSSNGLAYQTGEVFSQGNNIGLIQPTNYNAGTKYTSGSLILDDYRLPTKEESAARASHGIGIGQTLHQTGVNNDYNTYSGSSLASGGSGQIQYQSATNEGDNSGAYVHDPSGDYAEPYKHIGSPVEPYRHDSSKYKESSNHYDYERYSGASQGGYAGRYEDNSGQYVHDNSGSYVETGSNGGYSGSDGKYSGSDGAYSGSGGAYHGSDGGYSSGAYSGSDGGYSGSKGAYTASNGGNSAYAGSNGEYSGSNSAYSGSNGAYSGSKGGYSGFNGEYSGSNGAYSGSNGAYFGSNGENSGSYTGDYSGSYTHGDSGKYTAGVYRDDGHIGSFNSETGGNAKATSSVNLQQYHGSYSSGNAGNYLSDSKAYTGASHTLTAGAVHVGLVGKTTLVDADYNNQGNYQVTSQGGYDDGTFGKTSQSFSHGVVHGTSQNGHVPIVSQPAVSINHVGTDGNNLDGYSFVTTPTSSGIPTTATPFAVTTSLPTVTTYRTTFVPEAPKSSIKQIFGYSQPAVTFVQPTVVAQTQYVTPKVDYNQGHHQSRDYSNYNADAQKTIKSDSSGYVYSKPSIKFEDGVTYTTAAPVVVSTYRPQGFSHSQQTLHRVESAGFQYSTPRPVSEEPFKKLVAYTTGPSVTYAQPSVASYTPQAFSHQTIHKIESSNVYTPSDESGYEYKKPADSFVVPKTVVQYTTAQPTIAVQPTYQPQVFSQQTLHQVDATQVKTYSGGDDSGYGNEKPASGYDYSKPAIEFEKNAQAVFEYSTSTPAVSTYRPQSYSHQTFHKVETQKHIPVTSTLAPQVDLTYHQPTVTVYQNPILKYTENVTPVTYIQPTAQSYSHQTIHKVESSNGYTNDGSSGYQSVSYKAPKTVVQYTTAQPAVAIQPAVSTYGPQVYSHQTLHKVEASKVNTYSQDQSGYDYKIPASGYDYSKPDVKFEDAEKTVYEYSTPAPAVVSTYKPQSYSHQTIHKVETQKFAPVSSTQTPKVQFSYQQPSSGYDYSKPDVKFEEAQKVVYEFSTPAPAVVSTHKPQSYSHQTIHKVETQKFVPVSSTQSPKVEFTYQQPSVSLYENPILEYTQKITPVQSTATVYKQSYQPIVQQHQVSHIIDQPVQYETSAQHNLQSQEGYTYSQPEIQRNEEFLNTGKAYSDASLVSHQVYHQINAESQYEKEKDIVFVSSTPSTIAYEDHYTEYKAPKKQTYQAPEYIPPKTDYQQSYSVSTVSTPIVQQSSVYHQTQDQSDYKPVEYSQHHDTPVQKISFSTSHIEPPKKVESIHLSSYPGKTFTSKYNQVAFESPEIQLGYNAEEYLPPIVSTVASATTREYLPSQPEYNAPDYLPPKAKSAYLPPSTTTRPIIKSTYKPRTYSTVSTTREYLPPQPEYNAPEYLPPVTNTYLPPSTTARTFVKSTTQVPTYKYAESTTYKAPDYLPPLDENEPNIVNFESFGYKNTDDNIGYNPYQEYTVSSTAAPIQRKQNIVVETAKSNLLGFGTVGPDAGLVSPISYTTSSPVVSSSYANEYVEVSSSAPSRRIRPQFKSTTYAPFVESTTVYKAPDYLPPSDETEGNINYDSFGLKNFDESAAQIAYNYQEDNHVVSTSAPSQRKQNLVVETAKNQLLNFGSVGSDAGLVSSTGNSYLPPVTSTYTPERQELIEVSPAPRRKTKPKVAVVTKINDFNPLLVRKLGAVCSCQSPVLILKGKRPNVQVQQDFDDYSNDYDDSGRGDINDNEWAHKSARIQTPVVKTVTTSPIVTSTFNPIIVPDDSYYQDFQDSSNYNVDITPRSGQLYSQGYVSSTPPVVSTTEKSIRVRPRGKAITVAPTYKTVLLNQEVAQSADVKASEGATIESQSFDRYGPGGWRSRDETLQGSVDCQRAGLFRHPKQCNKFYACRWDCTKQRFTLHVFNCPVQLSFDPSIGACNWPSQGPTCQGDTLLTNTL